MQQATLINALQQLTRSGKPLIGAATDAPHAVGKLEPGQQIQGAVQSQVSAGIYKVMVAGQTIQMRLPVEVRSGEVLNLKVVTTKPQLTFSLAPSTTPISTQEQIGAAARMLSNLAELPLEKSLVQQLGSPALWQANEATGMDSKQLASALRNALANSGLFYESHQAQWVRGERSTSQLLVEPQNRLLENRNIILNHDRAAVAEDMNLNGSAFAPNVKTAHENGSPIARELLPLVQQQLHALETHQLTWTGQVWPGQQMQWEIQGQPEHRATPAAEREWSTEMELALPRLGDVHARLVFTEGGLKLNLRAADSETVALFNQHMGKLQSALAENQVSLTVAVVEKS